MNAEIPRALEAILLVADAPVETQLLAQVVELPVEEVEAALESLARGYLDQERGFRLVRVAGGWRYQTAAEMAPYVERFVLEGQSAKLSAAALETLAIVAYKQPISRAQIAAIRGVSVDGVVRTLEQRGYIGEVARDPGPGQAVLFGTTPAFLEKMGLDSLAQLPAIAEFVPGADVVEALEHGLRVEADEAPAPTGGSEATDDDHVTDVRDHLAPAPGDQTADVRDDQAADGRDDPAADGRDDHVADVRDGAASEPPAADRPSLEQLLDEDGEA
jgi:segregation and condensation protein B